VDVLDLVREDLPAARAAGVDFPVACRAVGAAPGSETPREVAEGREARNATAPAWRAAYLGATMPASARSARSRRRG
jgi:hypothetical protein